MPPKKGVEQQRIVRSAVTGPVPCLGCGEPFTPGVSEHICPHCAADIARDPDPWLSLFARRFEPGALSAPGRDRPKG